MLVHVLDSVFSISERLLKSGNDKPSPPLTEPIHEYLDLRLTDDRGRPWTIIRGNSASDFDFSCTYIEICSFYVTYDHRLRRIGHPVRSAIHKPQIGRLVVGWVTTSEYLLLYVFAFFVFAQVCRDF